MQQVAIKNIRLNCESHQPLDTTDENENRKTNTYKYKCHEYCTVYSTELFALLKALKHRTSNKTLICTDSLSVVNALKSLHPKNNMIQQIQDKLRDPNIQTTIMWIPSHTGIRGNEEAFVLKKTQSKFYLKTSQNIRKNTS